MNIFFSVMTGLVILAFLYAFLGDHCPHEFEFRTKMKNTSVDTGAVKAIYEVYICKKCLKTKKVYLSD